MTTWLTTEPLLSADDEVALARQIEAGVLASELLSNGAECELATVGELLALERAGKLAWQRFLMANLRLVWQVAHREARRSGLSAEDLFQEGFLGLTIAVRRWDHTRGVRFATLALPWIRRAILDVTATQAGAVPVPAWVGSQARRLRGLQSQLCQEEGRVVNAGEVARYLGVGQARVQQLLALAAPDSLQDAEGGLIDPAVGIVEEHWLTGELGGLVAALPPRERDVVSLRFGFRTGQPHSQSDVARRLGMSESTVRRLERRALDSMRQAATRLQAA